MFSSFGEDQGHAALLDRADNVGANHAISCIVIAQSLIQLMKFRTRVREGCLGRVKTGWANQDMMRERPSRHLALGVNPIANGTTLHENDRVMSVLASDGGGQAGHEFGFGSSRHQLKTVGGKMVAFINN